MRLREIQEEMIILLEEASGIVKRSGDKLLWDRAKAYWHSSIQMGLSSDHNYLGNTPFTLESAVESLEADLEDEEAEDEDLEDEL